MPRPATITSHAPAANTDAVVTLAAVAAERHYLWRVFASYSGAPSGAKLTIAFGASTVFDLDLAGAGPHVLEFGGLRNPDKNEAVTLTLAAGGQSVSGKLNVVSSRA